MRQFLVLSLLLAVIMPGYARHDGAYLRDVTMKLQTPHFDWATPYAQGKPKVLFITPRTLAPREIVELWQRFDLDFDAFTMAHAGLMSFESDSGAAPYDLAVEGTSIEEKTDEIVAKLAQKWDGFVLGNASLDALPREAQYKLLKQVSEGAGLLFVYGRTTRLPLFQKKLDDGRAQVTAGVPLGGIEFFKREDARKGLRVQNDAELPERMVETFAFGKGRIAVLQYGVGCGSYYGGHSLTPPAAWDLNWAADYEYMLSLVYRTMLWTMPARQPQVRFTILPAQTLELSREAFPYELETALESDKALNGKLLVVVRDHTNKIETQRELPLKLNAGVNAVTVEVPRVRAGEHFVDLIVRTAAGTENWGSVFVNMASPLTLENFRTPSEFAEKGQTPELQVSLSTTPLANTHVIVTLTDTNGRCYSRRDVAVEAGQTAMKPLKLDLSGATTIATRLHGELLVGNEVVDARDQWLFVPRRQNDEFRSVLWGLGSNTGLTWLGMQAVRDAGFTDHLSHPSAGGEAERLMAQCDLPLVCYAYRIMGHGDEKGWRKDDWLKDIEDGAFYNPELQAKVRDLVIGRIKNVIPYGPSLYSLGDENYFDLVSGFSPEGLKAQRSRLQTKYGDIAKLNALWGTDYKTWDQVPLLNAEDARKQGLWPLSHEHMGFNEGEYADYHHYLRDEIRKVDEGAWVGAEGSIPGDLEKTVEGMEIWGPYADKRGNELLRSLSGPDLVRGNWWGGYVGSHGGRAGAGILWRQLIAGNVNTSLYFAATGSEGLFATDMSFAKYFEDMLPDLQEIYGGIGQLISASRVADEGLAIHWSQASEHAATMFAGTGSPVSSQGNLLGLLDRNGLGYRFVTTKMVESGGLDKGARVLFLACSQAISDEEAARIRAFVDGGGTVVADVGIGNMNGVCRPLWKAGDKDLETWRGQLDDVLGITRKGAPLTRSVTTNLTFDAGGQKLALREFPFRPDGSVLAQTAANVEGVPVFNVRTQGKGKVIFLNFAFPNPEHPDGAEFMRGLMASVGVSPQAHLTDSKGYVERRFVNGSLTLVGVAREVQTAKDTALKLAAPQYVYDVRTGKALGKVDTVALPRSGPENRLFALLSEAAAPPVLQAPATAARGQASELKLSLSKAAGRIVRVQVLQPDGKEAKALRTYVTMKAQPATVTIPWALNAPAGTWTVKATDVATELAASAMVAVK